MTSHSDLPAASTALRVLMEDLWDHLDLACTSATSQEILTAELKIATKHGFLRLGRDADGERHLLVPVSSTLRLKEDRSSAGVHLTARTLLLDDMPVRFADLACKRTDLTHIFTGLVADVCARVVADPSEAASHLARTLDSWRLLFAGRSGRWTVPRLAGLFAEMLVLSRLLDRTPSAVRAWAGPDGAPQDFRSVHHAIEVKAALVSGSRVVRIHGVDQLETPREGTLHLAWFRVAVSSTQKALSVLDLLESCRAKSGDPAELEARLRACGMHELEHDPVAAATRFMQAEERWFAVGTGFPRITVDAFTDGAVPPGISGLEYIVDLDNVPARADQRAVLDGLVADL